MPIEIFEYLVRLEQQRFRAIILHARPNRGLSVTMFMKKVCDRINGNYLDALELFIQNHELNEMIDSFSPEKFQNLLIEKSQMTSLLCVDRLDFLLDTWRKRERKDFYRMIMDQWDGYKENTKSRLIISLQTSQEIEALPTTDTRGNTRVYKLSEFGDIL